LKDDGNMDRHKSYEDICLRPSDTQMHNKYSEFSKKLNCPRGLKV
jgi:hypothetical protein